MIKGMPAGRAGTPDEIGDLAEFLLSSRGRFISGTDILADGGCTASYWYGDTNDVLKVEVAVSGGRPHTVRFAVPDSFTFDSVRVPECVTAQTRRESGGRVLAVTLTAPKNGKVPVALKFK